jgi:hypothetical protein
MLTAHTRKHTLRVTYIYHSTVTVSHTDDARLGMNPGSSQAVRRKRDGLRAELVCKILQVTVLKSSKVI